MLPVHAPTPLTAAEREEMLAFACEAAWAAGERTLEWFRTDLSVERKKPELGFDPVTLADREAETVIRSRIHARYPDHGILGEEHGFEAGTRGLTWVIDPIDGTRAFITGMLHWGVLLALHDGEGPVLGVMVQPYVGEIWAGDGRHAWMERGGVRRTLAVRPGVELGSALTATTSLDAFPTDVERRAFLDLASTVPMVRYGTDCYAYALLAAGQIDLVVEAGLHPWDIHALIPIVRGAGGAISTWDGGNPATAGRIVAAGSESLRMQACARLGK